MLTNGGHLYFNKMGDLLLLPMKFHINEPSMAKILSFAEVAKIAGVHIKMETYKEKVINVHIEDGKIIHFKACAEGLFYTNLDYPTMITNHNNISLNNYSYLFTVKLTRTFKLILKLKERRKFEIYSNIFIGQEHQDLRLVYEK